MMGWIRNGTIVGPTGCQIDLMNDDVEGDDTETDWITVKGRTSEDSEALAGRLLLLLNG